jgi:transcriptional regulator with XRE-family HTH domain
MRNESVPREQIANALARNILRLLRQKGWNKSELARRANDYMPDGKTFGKHNVTSYTTGRSLPDPVYLAAMA